MAATDGTAQFQSDASFQFASASAQQLGAGPCYTFSSTLTTAAAWTATATVAVSSPNTFRLVSAGAASSFGVQCCQTGMFMTASGNSLTFANATFLDNTTTFTVSTGLLGTGLVSLTSALSGKYVTQSGTSLVLQSPVAGNYQFAQTASFLPVLPPAPMTFNATVMPSLPPRVGDWVFTSSNGSVVPDVAGQQTATASSPTPAVALSCVFGSCLTFATTTNYLSVC